MTDRGRVLVVLETLACQGEGAEPQEGHLEGLGRALEGAGQRFGAGRYGPGSVLPGTTIPMPQLPGMALGTQKSPLPALRAELT